MSSDTSDEENLEFLREATDNNLFKNSLYLGDGERSIVVEEKIEPIPSLRVKDEYDQFRLFNVTPQFQKHVGNALGEKLEKYLRENLVEYSEKKRKRKKWSNSIKLLNSSKYPIEVENNEEDNSKIAIKQLKPQSRNTCISLPDLKSVVVTGEEILEKKGTEFWSNRSKAPLCRYNNIENGVLSLIEPEFK